jgi:hypothetical protein
MVANKVSNNNISLKSVGADQKLFKGKDFTAKAGKSLSTKVMAQSAMKQMLSPKRKKEKD